MDPAVRAAPVALAAREVSTETGVMAAAEATPASVVTAGSAVQLPQPHAPEVPAVTAATPVHLEPVAPVDRQATAVRWDALAVADLPDSLRGRAATAAPAAMAQPAAMVELAARAACSVMVATVASVAPVRPAPSESRRALRVPMAGPELQVAVAVVVDPVDPVAPWAETVEPVALAAQVDPAAAVAPVQPAPPVAVTAAMGAAAASVDPVGPVVWAAPPRPDAPAHAEQPEAVDRTVLTEMAAPAAQAMP